MHSPSSQPMMVRQKLRVQCIGPECPTRVKLRRTQNEYMFSALPPNPDIARCSRHVSKVPTTEVEFSPDYPVGEREARGDRWARAWHWSSDTSAPRAKKRAHHRGLG